MQYFVCDVELEMDWDPTEAERSTGGGQRTLDVISGDDVDTGVLLTIGTQLRGYLAGAGRGPQRRPAPAAPVCRTDCRASAMIGKLLVSPGSHIQAPLLAGLARMGADDEDESEDEDFEAGGAELEEDDDDEDDSGDSDVEVWPSHIRVPTTLRLICWNSQRPTAPSWKDTMMPMVTAGRRTQRCGSHPVKYPASQT